MREPAPALRSAEMIRLDTLRALHERDHKLAAYCSHCQRWAVLDLPRLIEQGRGGYRFVGHPPRCRVCGELGQWQLLPPAYRDAATGGGASLAGPFQRNRLNEVRLGVTATRKASANIASAGGSGTGTPGTTKR